MQPLDHATNPFALMTDPQAVLAAVQLSDRLARLQSRVYRPLDQSQEGGRQAASPEAPVRETAASALPETAA
ncbi:hypothetical protein [Caldimonas brevitalea]|uniref:Uncharacterized protein n=1 Tax=Caldimonas brevitalea TaxID=413882 RepID=A0A0G3BG99_9BURK|nr:hypothetical protein [Caldimonas brevitalea]AKJ26993.1 hypothetical protein AAW51_0302 [Caldimonas brevitalea]